MATDELTPLSNSDFVRRQEAAGVWRQERLPAAIVGLTRDIDVYRARRSTNLITFKKHGDRDTYCPPLWWDLGIGSGACGLGCRACFLMLTFRMMRDPLKHVLYDNVEEFWSAAEKWLLSPKRRRHHTMGLGIDRSDSLLYEGVTGHARRLIPMFARPETNPNRNQLILLTKSVNVRYLAGSANEERGSDVFTQSRIYRGSLGRKVA